VLFFLTAYTAILLRYPYNPVTGTYITTVKQKMP